MSSDFRGRYLEIGPSLLLFTLLVETADYGLTLVLDLFAIRGYIMPLKASSHIPRAALNGPTRTTGDEGT